MQKPVGQGRNDRRLGVVLVAHGSRDPRAAEHTAALARAVADAHPEWEVHASYLDHAGPRPLNVLKWLALSGHDRAVLVPLLLTAAYHGKVDVPAVLDEARDLPLDIRLADVLGPASDVPASDAPVSDVPLSDTPVSDVPVPGLLVDGLIRRLPAADLDAVVLSAAGTRDAAARATVEHVATALGARLGLPCTVAYASAAPPMAGEAVRSFGAVRVGVASYFLAPGLLYDKAVASAHAAGAVVVAPPLGDAPELVSLIAARVSSALSDRLLAA
jgi:sirohydrochlorin ferrochelatase